MTHIRLRQPIIPIIVALIFGLQVMDPSRAWTILLVGFAGMLIASYLWAWTLGKNLQLRRETRLSWVQVGGQIEERLTLSNASLVPAPWVEFTDLSTLPDFDASKSISISAGYFDQWNVSAVCKQRGLFYLGGAQIKTGDPFGIFDMTIFVSERTSILVLPQITNLPEFMIAPTGSFGDGKPRRNAPQQTIHASSVREYFYGDSTRLIHWPTTARMNKVYVRLMESAPEGNWWVLLDLDHRHMLGTGWDSIEEQGVALAASLAAHGLYDKKSVGMIVNGKELSWLPPQKGEGQKWEILQALAIAKPGPLTLSSLLERMSPSLGKHHSLLIITASLELDWLKSLPSLTKRGVIPTVFLLDPETFDSELSANHAAAIFEQRGIQCHIIPRGMIEPPKMEITDSSKWRWHATPTGEIMPIQN